MDMMDYVLYGIIGLLGLLLAGAIAGFVFSLQNDSRLMDACMQDHKEYECVSMLRSRGGTTVMPMIIPVR